MSIALALGLKLALPMLCSGLGGHIAGGLLVSTLTKFGLPRVLAQELAKLAQSTLPGLLKALESPHIESLPPEQRNELQQHVAEVRRVQNLFSRF